MNIKVNPEFLKENNKEQLDKYQCPRCRYLLKDAVQTSCGHWLCNDCAVNLFEANSTPNCPREDCGETLTNEDGRPFFPDRFVRKEISKFNMICLNAKHGCPWSGQIGQLSDHLSMCQYDKQDCPHCQESFNSSELKKHIEVCPKAMTFCPLRDYGCDHQHEMTRKDCMDHVTSPGVMMTHLMLLISMITKLLPRSDSSILDRVESDGPNNSSSYNETPVQFRNATGRTTQLDSGGASAAAVQRKFPFVDPGFGSFGYNFDLLLNSLSSLPNSQKLMPLFVSVKQEIDVIRSQLTKKDNLVQQLQDKVQQLEATVLAKNAENEDRDFRLSLMENSNYDGTMVWKIPQFSQRREDARSGKYTSIFSLPFYSGRYGYKMCLRLYILGDGIGKGTHMSLFFVVMKGEFDNILQWPFTHKVTFKLINQCGGRDIVDIFQPDPMSTSFQKPKTDMNVASGCPRFVSSNELMQGGFIVDDTIFIKVKVDLTTVRHP